MRVPAVDGAHAYRASNPTAGSTWTFDFHGVGISITADGAVAAALRSRLRRFSACRHGRADLTFEYVLVPNRALHVVPRLDGPVRPVYDPSVGEVLYSDAEDRLSIEVEGNIRALCDHRSGRVVVSVVQSASEALRWMLSHPIFTLPLLDYLKRRGRYSVHAAGLAIDGKGLLIPGISGAGKSTLTLILLRAGFMLLGDDMQFLVPDAGADATGADATGADATGVRALAFPDEIDITGETARLFPELRDSYATRSRTSLPKQPVLPEEIYDVQFAWQARPSVLVFPRVARTPKSAVRPMGPDEALVELAPNVLLTDHQSSQRHLDMLARLVRQCPCYRLDTGRDFAAIPFLLRDLVRPLG